MSDLTIELRIKNMSEGLLYIGNEDEDRDIEIPIELEFDYSPAEAMEIDYPGCEEELILTKVTAPFGEIDIDTIQNMEQFNEDSLECMHKEGLDGAREDCLQERE